MQELLLLMALAAMSAGDSQSPRPGCPPGKNATEVAACGNPRGLDGKPLAVPSVSTAPPKLQASPAPLPAEDRASGSTKLGSTALEAGVPGRR